MDNQFNALCKLASAENWCWNLRCTTCGHMHFRYGFLELASGKSVNDSDWIVRRRKTSYAKQLGTLPKKYSESQKESVLAICTEADIPLIASECKFPDWLGHLGLVLAHMQSESDEFKLLSSKWAAQLQGLISPKSNIWHQLKTIVNQEKLLSLNDLANIESEIMHGNC